MPSLVLGVIPARGGSRGLPGKNIRPLGGVPLIGHSIAMGFQVSGLTRTIISTDDSGIADVARALGGDVPFLRPRELAADATPMAPVIRHALETVESQEGLRYDAVLLLDPTSPIRTASDLVQAIALLDNTPGIDGVVSVSAPTFDPLWVGIEAHQDAPLTRFFPEAAGVTRRQDNKRRYLRINGNFYLWTADFVRRLENSWLDEGSFLALEIPESRSFSIDDEYEFQLIEALAASDLVRLPAGRGPS